MIIEKGEVVVGSSVKVQERWIFGIVNVGSEESELTGNLLRP